MIPITCHARGSVRLYQGMDRMWIVIALVLAGCGPTVSYTRSSAQTFPPKPSGCALEAMSLPPARPFVELGTFDFEGNWNNVAELSSMADVVDKVRARACEAGADAILARKDGDGYAQAVALRWTEPHASGHD